MAPKTHFSAERSALQIAVAAEADALAVFRALTEDHPAYTAAAHRYLDAVAACKALIAESREENDRRVRRSAQFMDVIGFEVRR